MGLLDITDEHMAAYAAANAEAKRRSRAVNPKAEQAVADNKPPLDYLEWGVLDSAARVMKSGADKYGRRNYRDTEILASVYVGALLRHVTAWAAGEDIDPDTGQSHLAHVVANCMVVESAGLAGTLVDDRHEKRSAPAPGTRGGRRIDPDIEDDDPDIEDDEPAGWGY